MRTLIFSTLFAISTNFAIADTFSISSSDLLEDCLSKTFSNYAKQENKELNMKFEGSVNAIEAVKNGDVDMAIIAVPESLEYRLNGLEKYQIAYQSVVVSANENNSVESLSLNDLRAIYFNMGEQYPKTWSAFGSGDMAQIQALSTDTMDNLVVNLFKATLNPRENFATWVISMKDDTSIIKFIRGTTAAVSITGRTLNGTKTVPVISPVTTFPVLPSEDSLYSGEYPFKLTFYLVFKENNVSKIKEDAKFLLGNSVAEAFKNGGFWAAPEIFRKKFILELDISQ